jgi:hypothetical protein
VKNYQEKLNEKIAKIKELEDAIEESRQDVHDCLKIEEVMLFVVFNVMSSWTVTDDDAKHIFGSCIM